MEKFFNFDSLVAIEVFLLYILYLYNIIWILDKEGKNEQKIWTIVDGTKKQIRCQISVSTLKIYFTMLM